MMIINQCTEIWSTEWKYLVILDACRYDYFERIYKDYPLLRKGKLSTAISCGSTTYEWLKYAFKCSKDKRCNDIVYISANPFINSRGLRTRDFDPKKHLKDMKIIDVWDWGWSDDLGTVHPREVNKATLIAIRLHRNKRFIIHYLQPHYPYLSINDNIGGIEIKKFFKAEEHTSLGNKIRRLRGFIRWRIVPFIGNTIGVTLALALLKVVGPPQTPPELIAKRYGIDYLKQAYEENLRIVLDHLVDLLEKLPPGKVIVTADHG